MLVVVVSSSSTNNLGKKLQNIDLLPYFCFIFAFVKNLPPASSAPSAQAPAQL
jgi:hypothetical protein